MKKRNFTKCTAFLASLAILAPAVPAVNLTADAGSNLISNSTFESGSADWGTYKESGGDCVLGTENGQLALTIKNVGKKNYAVQFFYDIVPLYKNGVYRLKYDISSSVDRYVEGMIQQNGGTYQAYTWKGLNLTSTPQTVDYQFTMKQDTDIMAKLVFNCGLQEEDGELPEHKIFIDNVSLELVDDSNVDYASTRPYAPSININQVGYRTDGIKTAVFRDITNETEFSVVNADTNETVYTGKLENRKENAMAGETNYTGDFSSVKTAGKYYIKCGNLDNSYTFEIGDNVYSNLLDDSVKMLYLQRCGTQVNDSVFGHEACHNTMATVYGTDKKIDVTGGWHDAGDFGRYVVPGAKAVADIIYAYQSNPSLYGDSTGIPESGNGVADVLDEARYELEWMKKMQSENGGVYHKVTCETFPGYVMPEKETAPLIVTPVTSTATADFAGAMALAYEFYKDIDADFANDCLSRAERAWAWLEQNPNLVFENPKDITTGEYGDKSDRDERYWAAAQLYRATLNSKYLSALEGMSVSTGLDWATVGDYGNIALLTAKNIDKNSNVYTRAKQSVISQADDLAGVANASPYGLSQTDLYWGSNMTVANSGVILSLAYQLTDDAKYLQGAEKQLNYLLGTNPVGTSFVTGYGTVSPEHPHHRPSMAKGQAMKGMLVGGVNPNLEDSAAKAYCRDLPIAKRYVDNSESYSTNEICIYWNSPLTYLISMTEAENSGEVVVPPVIEGDVLWGDANVDKNVDIADAVLILQSIANPDTYKLSEQGRKNADVYLSGDGITASDALSIQKKEAGLLDTLPESYLNSSDPTVTTPPATTTTTTTQAVETTTTTTTANAGTSQGKDTPSGLKDYGTEMNTSATAVADFRKGESPLFFASDGWSNESVFDCGWYKENTSLDNGCLSLTIDKDKTGKYHYSGAEYRTTDFYHYGYYETSMQAIKNDGVVSSFFTYTGPTDVINGVKNPWDEIDIEILGKDTTKVQFNYYTDSKGEHEYMYDLGFDASEGYHTYGFDWQPDHIAWFVDGKEVYRATENIPSTAGKIMMNTWPGRDVDAWLKPYDGKTPLTARYQWVTYNK